MLVSTTHQQESAVGLPMSPPTWTSLPPLSPFHPWFYFLNWLSAALKQNVPASICPTDTGVHAQSLRCVQLFVAPWTVDFQAPLTIGFPRQEYWSGLPFPSPGDLPSPGVKPESPALAGGFFTTKPPGKPGIGERSFKTLNASGKSGGDSVLIPRN